LTASPGKPSDDRRRKPARRVQARVRDIAGRRVIAEGVQRSFWNDLYFNAMTASWPAFVGALAVIFVALNFAFALVYGFGEYALGETAIANARPGSLADLFFFSVETTSTVGYGDMHPQTIYGHVVATVENFVGLLLLAMMTGLVFARFSRPRARILFAKQAVVTRYNGVDTLIFRLANARSNFISEATAKLWAVVANTTEEGRRFVSFKEMRLLRSENPIFALSWTLFHPIDEQSPLSGMDEETLAGSDLNFIVSIVGYDETSAQTIHVRHPFTARDVVWGYDYDDFVWIDDNGLRHIDYAKIDSLRPAAGPASHAAEDLRDTGLDPAEGDPAARREADGYASSITQSSE
jgi:inward rectifier potassium channel